ncbi:MAG: phosphodiester glycosidase family protein [Clostridia bacterium]|nr:phosphodiester glycosidase family protein [Clostridia bacterium]
MTNQPSKQPNSRWKALRIVAAVVLNLAIVLSAVYILYHILDHFNPRLHFIEQSDLPFVPSLSIVIPILTVLSVLFYDLLFVAGAFKGRRFNKGRFFLIALIDVILFVALSLVIITHSCNLLMRLGCQTVNEAEVVAQLSTPVPTEAPTPAPTAEPTEIPTIEATQAPASADPAATPAPTDTPAPTGTPAPSTIPGLLGNKFAEKFTDEKQTQVYDASNVVETLADGTEKALIYTYSSNQVVVEIYRCKNGKQEYQIADIYVRDINCFKTAYRLNPKDNVKTQKYAEEIGAIVATNGDNFNAGKISDGLVIRNGAQLFPSGGKKQTRYTSDLCVIFYDGTMRVYDCKADKIDYDEILANYPYQAFYFGPKLLNEDGTAKKKFNSSLGNYNPRTVLGYYEPGHYSLLMVLGTREMIDYNGKNHGNGKSPGMTFEDLSLLCEQLGYTMAYNLDGGGSSSMFWNKTVYGHNDRTHGDILAVVDLD